MKYSEIERKLKELDVILCMTVTIHFGIVRLLEIFFH